MSANNIGVVISFIKWVKSGLTLGREELTASIDPY